MGVETAKKEEKATEKAGKAPSPEQKFDEVATKRLTNVLVNLRRVGNLANPAYDHEGHMEKYNGLLESVVAEAEGMMRSSKLTNERIEEIATGILSA